MKRNLLALFVLMFCLSIIGCNKTETEVSENADKYIGTYVCEDGYELSSFKLLSSGKVIWCDYTVDIVTDGEIVNTGEWILDNEQIYIFYDTNHGGEISNKAFILNVSVDENILSNGENVYSKVE